MIVAERRRLDLVKCPKCGSDVAGPVKTWPITSRKPLGVGETPKLAGIFECTRCRAKFRAAVDAATRTVETASIRNVVERIRGIRGELMQTLKNLREKIKTLETERANLMTEIDKLREVAESRVNALEGEVKMLRDEVKSLQDLLGYSRELEQ
jgi:predicted  nucleic acid-binding Zn-ribbon protein